MAVFGGLNTVLNILLDSVIFDGNLANADAGGLNISNTGQCILNLEIKNSNLLVDVPLTNKNTQINSIYEFFYFLCSSFLVLLQFNF